MDEVMKKKDELSIEEILKSDVESIYIGNLNTVEVRFIFLKEENQDPSLFGILMRADLLIRKEMCIVHFMEWETGK